ncbi:hypothetical protein L3X38_019372 [Prunus dulcis]|uniref:Uncharacterized protein n=1 Tax=Prunus dulcis TaxID=3755 RepID=A0AAD4WAX1_PRUDU|nr:hypothetical protein L3X38_019372 [Prunus dulcis]
MHGTWAGDCRAIGTWGFGAVVTMGFGAAGTREVGVAGTGGFGAARTGGFRAAETGGVQSCWNRGRCKRREPYARASGISLEQGLG